MRSSTALTLIRPGHPLAIAALARHPLAEDALAELRTALDTAIAGRSEARRAVDVAGVTGDGYLATLRAEVAAAADVHATWLAEWALSDAIDTP